MSVLDALFARLAHENAVLVSVDASQGSVPRDAGAWMAVFPAVVLGTIGGGHLELQAIKHARERLALPVHRAADAELRRYALGPSLGQCCGGGVQLRFENVQADDLAALLPRLTLPRQVIALFGGGHVGTALVRVLVHLPLQVLWFDSRDGIFPHELPSNLLCEHVQPVQSAVADLPSDAMVLIMSFSHAEDLDVVAACLLRQRRHGDLPFVGLIGSRTKWASFRKRLGASGFTDPELKHVTCPIGVPGIRGKEPEVIAVAVAAQILLECSTRKCLSPSNKPTIDHGKLLP